MKSRRTYYHRSGHQSKLASDQSKPALVVFGEIDASPTSLLTKEAAENLINEYFQYTSHGMPLLHKPTFMQKLSTVYNMSNSADLTNTYTTTKTRAAIFFVFEVFAVVLLSM